MGGLKGRKFFSQSLHMYAIQLVFAPGPLVASPSAPANWECSSCLCAKVLKVGAQAAASFPLEMHHFNVCDLCWFSYVYSLMKCVSTNLLVHMVDFLSFLSSLQVVLCFSPVGSVLQVRARHFPALINSTIIDWFYSWTPEALQSVSYRFIQEVEGIEVRLLNSRTISHNVL